MYAGYEQVAWFCSALFPTTTCCSTVCVRLDVCDGFDFLCLSGSLSLFRLSPSPFHCLCLSCSVRYLSLSPLLSVYLSLSVSLSLALSL